MNLPIETAHDGRAVVALEESQFHVLFRAHVGVSAFDQSVEVRRIDFGESGVDVENAVVPAPASDVVADPISDQILVVDLQLRQVSATSNDSGQRAATEIQTSVVVAQPNIEPDVPACPKDRSTWPMQEILEERVRQTSLEDPAHLLVPVVESM